MSLIAALTSPAGLRRVLWLDATSGAAMALAHLGLSGPLGSWLGFPPAWLLLSAWLVLPFVLLAATLARQPVPSATGLRLLALGNFVWVLASGVLALSGAGQPGALGLGYLLLQAALVLVLAELQWMALRRLPRLQPAA